MPYFPDFSNNNGTPTLESLTEVARFYAKATEGLGFVDSDFATWRALAKEKGIPFGAYHFGRPDQGYHPTEEADKFFSICGKPAPGELRPALDIEVGEPISDIPWAEAFVVRMRSHLGFWPNLYGSTSFLEGMLEMSSILRSCPVWRAEYSINDGSPHPLVPWPFNNSIHQYTNKGSIPGRGGYIDLNILMSDEAFVPRLHLSPLPADVWLWAQWYLGILKFAKYGPRDMRVRPNVPKVIPSKWWRAVKWYLAHGVKPK